MSRRTGVRRQIMHVHLPVSTSHWLGAGLGLAAGAYAAYVGSTWLRYGHPSLPDRGHDDLLDRFRPTYDAYERHEIAVAAPAAVTFEAAMDMALDDSALVRAIFKARELVMRSTPPSDRHLPRGI